MSDAADPRVISKAINVNEEGVSSIEAVAGLHSGVTVKSLLTDN